MTVTSIAHPVLVPDVRSQAAPNRIDHYHPSDAGVWLVTRTRAPDSTPVSPIVGASGD